MRTELILLTLSLVLSIVFTVVGVPNPIAVALLWCIVFLLIEVTSHLKEIIKQLDRK